MTWKWQIGLVAGAGGLALMILRLAERINTIPVGQATASRPRNHVRPLILPAITNLYQATTNLYAARTARA